MADAPSFSDFYLKSIKFDQIGIRVNREIIDSHNVVVSSTEKNSVKLGKDTYARLCNEPHP